MTKEEYFGLLKEANPNITLLSDYKGKSSKVIAKCNVCQYEYSTTADRLLTRKCPKCAGKVKLTTDEFKNKLKEITPSIEVLGEYVNCYAKILVRDNECGHEYTVTPRCTLKGRRCPICTKSKPMSNEEFMERIASIIDKVEIISEYHGSEYPITYKCKTCGDVRTVKAKTLLGHSVCKKCSYASRAKDHDEFKKQFDALGLDITLLSKYKTSRTHIKCKCNVCGYEWSSEPGNLLKKKGCSKCGNYIKYTHEEFVEKVRTKNMDVKILSEYNGVDKRVLCECLKCGRKWKVRASHLLEGSGCSACNISRGENRIASFFKSQNIDSIANKRFDDLRGVGGKKLSYDFYVPSCNALIEYQGKQHEASFEYFGGENRFEYQQEHDKRKREYAINNGYKFIEIWYYDYDNIEKILTEQIV